MQLDRRLRGLRDGGRRWLPIQFSPLAERARSRLEAAGEIDRVWESQGVGADAAPAFDTLKGKTIELRWRYYATEGDERKQVCARLPSLEHSHAKCA